jgi:hypothetical protein
VSQPLVILLTPGVPSSIQFIESKWLRSFAAMPQAVTIESLPSWNSSWSAAAEGCMPKLVFPRAPSGRGAPGPESGTRRLGRASS